MDIAQIPRVNYVLVLLLHNLPQLLVHILLSFTASGVTVRLPPDERSTVDNRY